MAGNFFLFCNILPLKHGLQGLALKYGLHGLACHMDGYLFYEHAFEILDCFKRSLDYMVMYKFPN